MQRASRNRHLRVTLSTLIALVTLPLGGSAQGVAGLPKSLKPAPTGLETALEHLRAGWQGASLAMGHEAPPSVVGEALVRRLYAPLKQIGLARPDEGEEPIPLKASLKDAEEVVRRVAAALERHEVDPETARLEVQRALDDYLAALSAHLASQDAPSAGGDGR